MADLLAELRRSGESVPAEVIRDLRSAKTMIEILKVDRSHSENLLRIEEYLNKVESYVLPAAQRRFAKEFYDEWMSKIGEAGATVHIREPKPSTGFPIGVPRGKHWVRIKPSEAIPKERIKQISEDLGLEYRTQENGHILVYGGDDELKILVKKTAELFHESEVQCQEIT